MEDLGEDGRITAKLISKRLDGEVWTGWGGMDWMGRYGLDGELWTGWGGMDWMGRYGLDEEVWTGWGGIDWMNLVQDRDRWLAPVNVVMYM